MASQIEDVVQNCAVCSKYQKSNTKEPLLCHEPSRRPWEKVGADLCEYGGHTYLVLVYYYSNFIEVDHLKETASAMVITRFKSHFYGIPDVLFTDNGPQFSSHQFSEFSDKYQFRHDTSSPYFPQSNGKVGKAVQTVKNILKKAHDDRQDPYLALLALRNTPIDGQVGSPVQQLMGKRTKTLLPTTEELLQPKIIRPSAVRSAILKRQRRQKYYYDRLSRPLPSLKVGESVIFQNNNNIIWKPATVTSVEQAPRSYVITTPEGQMYRRNRRHIRRFQSEVEPDDGDDTFTQGGGVQEPDTLPDSVTAEEGTEFYAFRSNSTGADSYSSNTETIDKVSVKAGTIIMLKLISPVLTSKEGRM